MEFFEQVEDDVRFPVFDGIADRRQFGLYANHAHVMSVAFQRLDDVVLGLPDIRFVLRHLRNVVGRNQIRVRQTQDTQRIHTANHCLREACSWCATLVFNRRTIDLRSSYSRPGARSFSARALLIRRSIVLSSAIW